MGWFKRNKEGITTSTKDKKETPEGLWHKCPKCKVIVSVEDHEKNLWVCGNCEHHDRINAKEYFSILFDDGKFTELNPKMTSGDPLKFEDTKKYTERYAATVKRTGLNEALTSGYGKINDRDIVIACMNFNFIGGSMGSVVGEKIARAIDHCIKYDKPFLMISKSGGARMMEAAFSLMQMAKTSAKLALLGKKGLPYISMLTDPTTGGVTASFAMLGDINIAEPGALIGFAGPRVVKETIGKDLPEGFQTSEFVLEHGFLDFIVKRKNLKDKISQFLDMTMPVTETKTAVAK
ncbi:MAG: acetyl-CoA carboxylase carboxyl transferase subunit beta [Owenweeksia sp.]|nr:acetyl-CoA carboxylase carboxyl transferase subunit beta [Owenweeksia sp.]MBF98878.1 acetyl-CoA carboxylase carboxyl transferase subunit beta [Owenweeksia sp.]HBF19117.1 acetyl-CoA carboxylase carboxyl transferase subunit beta [Cryomorphaceae bacterium]|tara:strand:- start:20063 stop:20938 length:876 start_codon:yes stop_codon:yes gene_type:complete